MYLHTARFQILLRDALRLQSLEPIIIHGKPAPIPYSDENLLKALNLDYGRTTLTKFRNAEMPSFDDPKLEHMHAGDLAGGLRDVQTASRLWDHLSARGYVQRALPGTQNRINKKDLFSDRQVANTISAFFDTHEMQIEAYSKKGLAKNENDRAGQKSNSSRWLCFKRSWYKPNHIVKSLFTFTNMYGEYFNVSDFQKISGRFGEIEQEMTEKSIGFAISKSEKLWCFLRESERDQPRIFCFFRPVFAKTEAGPDQTTERLSLLYGHVMETERRRSSEFYSTHVILISPELDEKEWRKTFPNSSQYILDDQIDVFPLRSMEIDREYDKPYRIPQFVIDYLNTGNQIL